MNFLPHDWFYILTLALFVGMHLTGLGFGYSRMSSHKRRQAAPWERETAKEQVDLNYKRRMAMGRARQFAVFAIVAVVALAVGYGGWRAYRQAQPEQCYACQRPIHAQSRTVAFANGSARLFCCPACALSEQQQEGKAVRVSELTAFVTGAKLSPNGAYVVKGSDVNMCAHTHELIDADKRPADIHYDRCAPSLIAFAQEREAVQFSRDHGGTVLPFQKVATEFAK